MREPRLESLASESALLSGLQSLIDAWVRSWHASAAARTVAWWGRLPRRTRSRAVLSVVAVAAITNAVLLQLGGYPFTAAGQGIRLGVAILSGCAVWFLRHREATGR